MLDDARASIAAAVAAVPLLYALHRLALRLEERGLVYYWHKKPEIGASRLWFPLQAALEPQSRNIREVDEHTPPLREDEPEPERPSLAPSGERFAPMPLR